MPVYEYKCGCSPENIKQYTRAISDPEPEYRCDNCGLKLQRHYGSFGIQFKGSGFYKTDNPK